MFVRICRDDTKVYSNRRYMLYGIVPPEYDRKIIWVKLHQDLIAECKRAKKEKNTTITSYRIVTK